MEDWSDLPIENFKIKFFLDTNILVFLVNDSHICLTKTINILNESKFVDLVSSNFVIFEFTGVRKKEHYLKEAVKNPKVDISTLLKFGASSLDIPEADYDNYKKSIEKEVQDELKKITTDFGIDYSTNILHSKLLSPTLDICLSSKISKEDSLVLASALMPDIDRIEKHMFLLSKDDQFTKAYNSSDLTSTLANYSLSKPYVENITNIKLDTGTNVNLTNPSDESRLDDFFLKKIFQEIIKKNTDILLGYTFTPNGSNFPQDAMCFKLNINTNLPKDIFITFIANDLSFIYTTKHSIKDFWLNGSSIGSYPFVTQDESNNNISFKVSDDNNNPLDQKIMSKLRLEGNAVFIHPDSNI